MNPTWKPHLTFEEANLRWYIRERDRATTFEDWLTAQLQVDAAWRAMGYAANGYTHFLVDEELIFPNVRRSFNGKDKD